jgi:hypothetical protein
MMRFKMMLAVATLLTICLSSAAAYANNIVTLTLTNPTATVWAVGGGGTLTFTATVSAPASNTGLVFLNGDSFNVPGPISLDDNDFYNNFPLDLAPGTSFTGDLFQLTVPAHLSRGSYVGDFTLQGGADGGASASLATVAFTVNAVPEPSSVMLLLSGVAGLGWFGFKRNLRGRLS